MFRLREFKFESSPAKKYKRQQSNCLNKYYDKTVSKPFFLTRQTANLMEDFARELNQGSALFLLYGEIGVGKTRLLQELGQSRLSERAIFWLDLDSEDGSDETRLDRSTEVEALFAAAGNGDIIIADHFEMALKKTRHQLFLSWSTDGIDKQLNLIVASSSEGLDELRQLSQQYQTPMQSFQLMPFGADEVQAFLGFYLFPDHPPGKLSMPSALSKQIAATQGIVGRVIEIVDREGSQIQSTTPAPTEPSRRSGRMIIALLFLVVLALGAGWYMLRQSSSSEIPALAMGEPDNGSAQVAVPEAAVALEAQTATTADASSDSTLAPAVIVRDATAVDSEPAQTSESTIDTEAALTSESTIDPEPALASESRSDPEPALASETTVDREPTLAVESTVDLESSAAQVARPENSTESPASAAIEPLAQAQSTAAEAAQEPGLSEAEPGTASDSEAVIVERPESAQAAGGDSVIEPPAPPRNSQERFDLELRQSLDWIRQRDDSVGTIQIMLLSYASFDPDNYYNYVADLARKQVDTERLHVFKTYLRNREVYSVVYDEFASRRLAQAAIDSLPAVLRDTAPLARSVGGLWQEIRRLESNN